MRRSIRGKVVRLLGQLDLRFDVEGESGSVDIVAHFGMNKFALPVLAIFCDGNSVERATSHLDAPVAPYSVAVVEKGDEFEVNDNLIVIGIGMFKRMLKDLGTTDMVLFPDNPYELVQRYLDDVSFTKEETMIKKLIERGMKPRRAREVVNVAVATGFVREFTDDFGIVHIAPKKNPEISAEHIGILKRSLNFNVSGHVNVIRYVQRRDS